METGWLIELANSSPPVYFGVETQKSNCEWTWTTDHMKAIRFSRREDAEHMLKAFGWFTCHATEHIWDDSNASFRI